MESKDQQYAIAFFMSQPKGMRQVIENNIRRSAPSGIISIFADMNGLTEQDKQRLSAYRVVASEMGFAIGQWRLNRNSGTCQASIKSQ